MSTQLLILLLAADSLASGFLGWLLGRTARNAELIADEVVDADAEPAEDAGAREARSRALLARVRAPYVVMALLAVIVGVTAFLTGSVAVQQRSTVRCVADYSNDLGAALDQRADANKRLQDKQDAIWLAVSSAFAHPGADPKGTKIGDAVDDYNTERDRLRTAQARHPLPETPRGACAGLSD